MNNESSCVDIQIYDLVKAFDVLWLADSFNNLWDTLPDEACDDRLGIIYTMSVNNLVAINTSVGQTERKNIPKIVTQGGTWGPILCSNSIDGVGKYALDKGHSYRYKNVAPVIPMGMVDDLLAIAKCRFASTEINSSINTIIELKKLRFHTPQPGKKGKCHFLHVGKPSKTCVGMKVHGEKAEQLEETEYLGDNVRADGKNTSTVKVRVGKGFGLVSEILMILKTISFGRKHFEIAKVLRDARLINGILTNAEVWYSLGKMEVAELEKVDKLFLRKLLAVSDAVPSESLYLELGLIPISVILKSRRVLFLHYLIKLNKDEMLF